MVHKGSDIIPHEKHSCDLTVKCVPRLAKTADASFDSASEVPLGILLVRYVINSITIMHQSLLWYESLDTIIYLAETCKMWVFNYKPIHYLLSNLKSDSLPSHCTLKIRAMPACWLAYVLKCVCQ